MKKIIICSLFLLSCGIVASAQCDKKVTWTGPRAIFLDASGNQEKVDESTINISTSKTDIMIHHGDGPDDVLSGKVTDLNCDWKEAFKNGKMIFKAALADPRGDTKDATITIEAKDGKIVFTVELAEMQGRKIQVPIDSYKEDK